MTNLIENTEELFSNLLDVKHRIEENLYLLEEEIIAIVRRIEQSNSFEECDSHFSQLLQYITFVDKVYVKHKFDISRRLTSFLDVFRRIDDLQTQRNIYEFIKSGYNPSI